MENRSFDHYLGWVKGAAGRQRGLEYLDEAGVAHATHHLATYTGCGSNDPSHSYNGGRIQLNGGACDGFRRGSNDDLALGYYTRDDLALTSQLVDTFTVCDHWFASILAPTYPNRFYTHSAATDRIRNTFDLCTLPTVWDHLADAGVSAGYYYSDVPFLALYGAKYLPIAAPISEFFADAAAGTLPSYTYVDPAFLGAAQNDDHPHADIRRGQNLMGRIVQAVIQGPLWESTLLVITYDEWGGFFDTVAPPRLSGPRGQPGWRRDQPGPRPGRVPRADDPRLALQPTGARGHGRSSSTARSQSSSNGGSACRPSRRAMRRPATWRVSSNFNHPDASRPVIDVPPDPGPDPCGPTLRTPAIAGDDEGSTWADLAASDLVRGWHL